MRNHVWTLLLIGTLAPLAPLPVFAADPLPPPSLANDCGRAAAVDLKAIPGTHVVPLVPMKQVRGFIEPGTPVSFPTQEEGGIRTKVVVDKDGKPAEVSVAESSGSTALEVAVTKTVRERYRWEAPPPECQAQGVVVYVDYISTIAPKELLIFADDPRYPPAVHARKMGAMGVVGIRYRKDIDAIKAIISTGSDAIDEAMMKIAADALRPRIQSDPQKYDTKAALHVTFLPDYISSTRVAAPGTAQAALPAPLRTPISMVAPGVTNNCGRTAPTRLTPIMLSHRLPPYPPDAARHQEQGMTLVRVTVDKTGTAGEVVVISSSGYAALDDSAVDALKGKWRWEPPPPECAESGVVLAVMVNWGVIPQIDSLIFIDDPDYPEQARLQRIGAIGAVAVTVVRNKPTEVRVITTTGSAEFDAAMIKWAEGLRMRSSPGEPSYYQTIIPLQFKPFEDPYTIDVLMGPPAPRPDH